MKTTIVFELIQHSSRLSSRLERSTTYQWKFQRKIIRD